MGSSKPISVEQAVEHGHSRGYVHVVSVRSPGRARLHEIREWMTANYFRRSYFRFGVADATGAQVVVWCFRDENLAFSFKMRFG